jgi:hypothetical protein
MNRTLRIAAIVAILALVVAWGLTRSYTASLEAPTAERVEK